MNLHITETLKHYFSAGSYQIRILVGTLFAAIVADGVITRYLVHNGLAREGNPFMEYWVTEDKLLTLKICGGLLAVLYLWSVYRRHPRLSIIFTSILLTGYIFIVGWNLHILL
jgi:H+/Cl- antiporter ClcA